MTCDACELAARGVTGLFSRDRKCCQARAIARSPYFAESLRSGRQTRMYRDALEAFGVTHEQVIEAARADRECDSIVERMEKRDE